MKFISKFRLLILIIIHLGFIACATSQGSVEKELPDVINPTYQSYNVQGEKGYKITFEYNVDKAKPQEVVLFGIRQKIPTSAFEGNNVMLYMIHQTQIIDNNNKIMGTELPNGVIFEIGEVKYLKKVNFTSK